MKLHILVVLSLVAMLAGCDLIDPPLTNQQIVEQVAYCKAHGLKPHLFYEPLNDGMIHSVQCAIDDKELPK